jgi:hypothetical protein
VTEALRTSNIKTMHFILRTIDEEEKLCIADAFTPIYLTLARARTHARMHVPSVTRDYWNCHTKWDLTEKERILFKFIRNYFLDFKILVYYNPMR